MGRLRRIFNRIIRVMGLTAVSRPQDIPKKLTPEELQKAMQEARFLVGQHAVDVKALMRGETPGLPRRADSDEPVERSPYCP